MRRRTSEITALVGRSDFFEILSGVDESDVSEGLGKISDQPLSPGVVLLGEQAEGARLGDQCFEKLPRFFHAAELGKTVDQPE